MTGMRLWTALLFLLVGSGLVGASSEGETSPSSGPGTTSAINWTTGEFTLTMTAPMTAGADLAPPKRRYLAEQQMALDLEAAFVAEASRVPVDSGRTLGDLLASDPTLLGRLQSLAAQLKFRYSRVDEAYTSLEMRWSASLWSDFQPLLEEVNQANPVPRRVSWSPTREVSGLVIFAMGNLPWLGTNKLLAPWKPSLSFRLLSPDGEVQFDRSMNDPLALETWGQAGFSEGKFNEQHWVDRIGLDPLRIVARGVFGRNPGDLVLSNDDWNRILADPHNRELLAQGRILILWGDFPDYSRKPNPDSVINEAEPAIQVIPQKPIPSAETQGAAGGH